MRHEPGDQGASTGLARTDLAVKGLVAGCGAKRALAELTPAAATARDRSWTMLARHGLLQPKLQLSCLARNSAFAAAFEAGTVSSAWWAVEACLQADSASQLVVNPAF